MIKHTLVPKYVLLDDDLSDMGFRVYVLLNDYAYNNIYAYPTIEKMAEDLGKSITTIKRGIKELKEKGLIKIFRKTHISNNIYILVPPALKDEVGEVNTQQEFYNCVEKIKSYYQNIKPQKKRTKNGVDYMKVVEKKLENKEYDFSVQEVVYLFKLLNKKIRDYNVNTNFSKDINAVKQSLGIKDKYGEYDYRLIEKYIKSYDSLFRSDKYPNPTIFNMGASWVYAKIKRLVDDDIRQERVKGEQILDIAF